MLALALGAAGMARAVVPLPQLVIDPAQTSVSGLSAGGFMAVQLHVAYSGTFRKGAGIVAGGPFHCAQGSVLHATGRCMAAPSGIPTASLVAGTNSWAQLGFIDPVSNLGASRVYLFSGSRDSSVKTGVMDALQAYYASFVPAANLAYKKDLAAEHAMVTDDYGASCATRAAPYINDCDFDLAGALLQQLNGPLNPRNGSATLPGSFVEYDQTPFLGGHGMGGSGWAYVPQACAGAGPGGVPCRLHVVLHGCKQNTAEVGQQFVRSTGYNRWADTNRIVVLYPQTGPGATNGCWDWWGYDDANYARKSGRQMVAVKAMVDRVSSGAALAAPVGVATSGATASSMVVGWSAVAGAAGYNVYRGGARRNALPVAATAYTDTGLAPGTAYSWTVKAASAAGAEGPASVPASGTTTGGPPPPATCITASNYAHTLAARAYVFGGFAFASGSSQNMGLWTIYTSTTLKKTGTAYYEIGSCP